MLAPGMCMHKLVSLYRVNITHGSRNLLHSKVQTKPENKYFFHTHSKLVHLCVCHVKTQAVILFTSNGNGSYIVAFPSIFRLEKYTHLYDNCLWFASCIDKTRISHFKPIRWTTK